MAGTTLVYRKMVGSVVEVISSVEIFLSYLLSVEGDNVGFVLISSLQFHHNDFILFLS